MKYLKTYNELNEGLRDKMTGKSDDELDDILYELDPNTLLFKSCIDGYLRGVEVALERGADINLKLDTTSVLSFAAINNHPSIVKYLVEKGAMIDVDSDVIELIKKHMGINEGLRDKMLPKSDDELNDILYELDPTNLLEQSTSNDYLKGVQVALERGADVNLYDGFPLRQASLMGYIDIVRCLLDNGADVNANYSNALIWSSEEGHADVVQLLLDNGADVNARSGKALELAKKGNHDKVVQIIKKHMGINEGLRDKMLPKSDEEIASNISKLNFNDKINILKEQDLDRIHYPPMEEIEKYLSKFTGEKRISEIFELKVFEFLPVVKDGYYYIGGDLELDGYGINRLPDNLYVKRNLYCSENLMKELPRNLIVGESLYCAHGTIEKIPNDIKIGKDINLVVNNITELPENLTVNGNLDIDYNPIDRLPKGLVVKGNLYCVQTNLLELPDDLIVNGTLYTAGTSIRNKSKKPTGVNELDPGTRRF